MDNYILILLLGKNKTNYKNLVQDQAGNYGTNTSSVIKTRWSNIVHLEYNYKSNIFHVALKFLFESKNFRIKTRYHKSYLEICRS